MLKPSIGVKGIGSELIGSGINTSMTCPALTRSDFGIGLPPDVMSPSSSNLTTAVRESPNTRVSALSIRSPATPSGTVNVRAMRLLIPMSLPLLWVGYFAQ